jgi:hypothetical protein
LSNSNPELPLRRVAKVYVAGSSAELERCEAAIALLEASGVHVTSTWPIVVRDHGGGNPRDASRDRRRLFSVADLGQVREADLVWVLVPPLDCPTRGAWLEAGYAHGLGKLVVFSGDTLQSIFCATGNEFADDASAFEFVQRICDAEVPVAKDVKQPKPRRAFLSVSRAKYELLEKASQRTGAPIAILVELAVSPEIGAPLSPQAQEWAAKLAGAVGSAPAPQPPRSTGRNRTAG